MEADESQAHSFVIRIEASAAPGQTWQGYISHVPEGERRYFRRLGEIPVFIAPYLRQMGQGVGWCTWLWRWFRC
ncbi:MAG TPA: hypothetical protein VFS50_11070 [Meiothermus sp.]|jgi:hypothetical protein|nr:hypothetical protein [Meiothermus sp.]